MQDEIHRGDARGTRSFGIEPLKLWFLNGRAWSTCCSSRSSIRLDCWRRAIVRYEYSTRFLFTRYAFPRFRRYFSELSAPHMIGVVAKERYVLRSKEVTTRRKHEESAKVKEPAVLLEYTLGVKLCAEQLIRKCFFSKCNDNSFSNVLAASYFSSCFNCACTQHSRVYVPVVFIRLSYETVQCIGEPTYILFPLR